MRLGVSFVPGDLVDQGQSPRKEYPPRTIGQGYRLDVHKARRWTDKDWASLATLRQTAFGAT